MDPGDVGPLAVTSSIGVSPWVGEKPRFLWRAEVTNGERRNGYTYNRVLIEASRVLDTQFSDAVVFLTGAQIEMLRNVSQYLSRRDTYVTEYKEGYYITPSDEDYDSILQVVADMEETLMGNPNVIWGYGDTWVEEVKYTVIGDGSYDVDSDPVPAGYVYTLQSLVCRNLTSACGTVPKLVSGVIQVPVGPYVGSGATIYRIVDGVGYTLKEGDKARCRFYSCLDGDELELFLWGYKMVVPEE